jgi:AAA+ superfamily predicted ATPase
MANQTFDQIDNFPDPEFRRRYDDLVGLDEKKTLLSKEGRILINPALLDTWSEKHYKKRIKLVDIFRRKPALFIFSGDVGTGKTSLAETFGDALARQEKMSIYLYRLSLKSRGNGMVGDMTGLIGSAFEEVYTEARKAAGAKKVTTGYILLIDEADALAQSRESSQMHHEDKAGVNALIRGIDTIATSKMPVLIVMCTNRLSALDPAVRRRAASIFEFNRPNEEQRQALLEAAFADTAISEKGLGALVKATGPSNGCAYGFTYSDLTQRLLPGILLQAFPDEAINFDQAIELANSLIPTPPFKEV